MRLFLAVPMVWGYVPERTPQREKLFFGVEDDGGAPLPVVSVIAKPSAVLPPASSQIGVNTTATFDHSLNDFGVFGKPAVPEIATGLSKLLPGHFFTETRRRSSPSMASTFIATAKQALEYLSVVWLILLLVGCYLFLKAAMNGALSKRYTLVSTEAKIEATRDLQNRRIDREAYVYIEGG